MKLSLSALASPAGCGGRSCRSCSNALREKGPRPPAKGCAATAGPAASLAAAAPQPPPGAGPCDPDAS
eukprot:5024543-Pyramimonas_sp.AAC.1